MYAGTGEEPPSELIEYAEIVITVCIMSIVITAPIGAIVITIAGPRLLSKTTKPPVLEGKLLYLIDTIHICYRIKLEITITYRHFVTYST